MVRTRSGRCTSRMKRVLGRPYVVYDAGLTRTMFDFVAIDAGHHETDTMSIVLDTLQSSNVDPQDMCVISQQTYESLLGEVEGEDRKSFLTRQPDITISTLPCGHIFDIVAVAKHFVLNSLTCPICRSGIPKKASVRSLPPHLRSEMRDTLQRCRYANRCALRPTVDL